MIYLVIGIPLTLILLSDIGIIITRFLKFTHAFLTIFFNEGYIDRFRKLFRRRLYDIVSYFVSFIFRQSNKTKPPAQTVKLNTKPPKTADNQDDTASDIGLVKIKLEKGVFDLLTDISVDCLEKTDEIFDFSPYFLIGFIFIYLTIGALYTSRLLNLTLFNGYYFTLIALVKIGMDDFKSPETSLNNEPIVIILRYAYVLFGISFFSMTISYLQLNIREVLLHSGENLIIEFIKFVNQFGYNLTIEHFNICLEKSDNLNKSSSHLDSLLSNNSNANLNQKDDLKRVDSFKFRSRLPSQLKGINLLLDVPKSDKQTQITTLLYSKVKPFQQFVSSSSIVDDLTFSKISSEEILTEILADKIKEIDLFKIDDSSNNKSEKKEEKKASNIVSPAEVLTKTRRSRFEFNEPKSVLNKPNMTKISTSTSTAVLNTIKKT